MSGRRDDVVKATIAKLSPYQQSILLRVRGDDWFRIQWEGWRSFFGWRTFNTLGLTWPREPGMQTLSPHGKRVRDYLVMLEHLA